MTDFLRRRRASLDPPRFQGWGRRSRYFEGWYFKVVDARQGLAYAFIPGISYDEHGGGHSFLQVLDGAAATSTYHQYPTEEFRPDADRFALSLAGHYFSADRLRIDLPGLQIDLELLDPVGWPARPLSPGVMGWYGFVPGMQCYHGLVSFHHRLGGTVTVGDRNYRLSEGIGYTEKDWGRGFPDAWIWTQSNHLTDTDRPASLMASVASIPWLGTSFVGFLCTFLLEGVLYTFTTWTGAKVSVDLPPDRQTVRLTFTDPRRQLVVTGRPAAGGTLASPIAGAMTGKINESLRAEVNVQLVEAGEAIYTGTATWAGLEVSENAADLLTPSAKNPSDGYNRPTGLWRTVPTGAQNQQ